MFQRAWQTIRSTVLEVTWLVFARAMTLVDGIGNNDKWSTYHCLF